MQKVGSGVRGSSRSGAEGRDVGRSGHGGAGASRPAHATIDGSLLVLSSGRARESGVVYYAKWRDSTRTQVKRKLGPAWVERHGGAWRKRRGRCPEGYLVPSAAARRMREAIEEHERDLAERRRGRAASRRATFAEVAQAWHEHGQAVAGWKPATIRDRRSTLRVHLLPAFGRLVAADIGRDDVRRWWNGLHDSRRRGGRLSERNANKLLAELRAILNWGAEAYGLASNPADGIRKHRELTSERPDFYSVEEVEELAGAASSEQDAVSFRTAAYAGLRRGELVSLRWRHIDVERAHVHVVESVSAGEDARVKDYEGRTVPLAPQLAAVLQAWRPPDARPGDLVFPGTVPGRKLDGDALSTRFRAARDRAGVRALRLHDLRHTFGTLAVDGGASLVQVQAWMGHADIKTTMRYLHTKNRAADAALLGAAFGGNRAQVSGVEPRREAADGRVDRRSRGGSRADGGAHRTRGTRGVLAPRP